MSVVTNVGFRAKLNKRVAATSSLVCVGIDSDPAKVPNGDVLAFNKKIVDATAPYAACYKLQLAFYEQEGPNGLAILLKTVEYIREATPDTPLIGDAKRCDIPNTTAAYAKALFGYYGFDAVTVVPYAGWDSVKPFISYSDDVFVFVICHMSNPGSGEIQELELKDGRRLYEWVAQKFVREGGDQVGLVVGATYPKIFQNISRNFPNTLVLAPGVGSQGAKLQDLLEGVTDIANAQILINSSRSIIYANDSAAACRDLRDDILARIEKRKTSAN